MFNRKQHMKLSSNLDFGYSSCMFTGRQVFGEWVSN